MNSCEFVNLLEKWCDHICFLWYFMGKYILIHCDSCLHCSWISKCSLLPMFTCLLLSLLTFCHKAAVLATTLKWFFVRSVLFYVYLELIYNFKSYVMLVVCKCWYILWIVQEYDVEDSVLPLQPSLNYTAPEYVRSKASSGGCSSDIFSFGCLAYHLIARKPLFNCNNNVKMVCVI